MEVQPGPNPSKSIWNRWLTVVVQVLEEMVIHGLCISTDMLEVDTVEHMVRDMIDTCISLHPANQKYFDTVIGRESFATWCRWFCFQLLPTVDAGGWRSTILVPGFNWIWTGGLDMERLSCGSTGYCR